jgi:hypothetical protein
MSSRPNVASALLMIPCVGACAADEAQFNVQVASGYTEERTTVSLFGVYKDGRVSAEAWDAIGPAVSASLGKPSCETAYNGSLVLKSPKFAAAIDDYVRASGVTDDLLAQLAPAALGDTIMVVSLAGHVPQRLGHVPRRGTAPSNAHGEFGGHGAPPPSYSYRPNPTDGSVLEVSATVFSVRLHHSVARLHMTYSGKSVEGALQRFTERLRAALPGASCAGWDWSGPMDDAAIRNLPEP